MEPDKKEKAKQETKEWALALLIAVVVALFIRIFIFEPVVVEQTSMYPTLEAGQKLGLFKAAYLFAEPERGDIIVFRSDEEGGKALVKRVIALGGETFEVSGGTVLINGEALTEEYLQPDVITGDYPQITVPEGCVFVMGDNRGGSLDSRSFGPVNIDRIKGRIILRLRPFTLFPKITY